MSNIADENPNHHIIDYLNYYCDPDNRCDFAVMLKGAWGSGKTHCITRFKEDRQAKFPNRKILYVTLYGVMQRIR
jgi:chromosomal replication initiation ATPase DnaA